MEAANGSWIAFPWVYRNTPIVTGLTVEEIDARYVAQAHNVNATGFYLYLWDDTAGAVEAVAKTINYIATLDGE